MSLFASSRTPAVNKVAIPFTMVESPVTISLVVATLGREAPLYKLFESLSGQTKQNFEVIIVDQNGDDRLAALVGGPWPFNVTWIHEPNIRGSSRARNIGWRAARGQILLFPDDDCWYPPWFLVRGEELMASLNADIVTGRAADELGQDINGRFAQQPHRIDRENVWVSGIEWMMLFKKSALIAVGGFDERVGVGAATPWQACEGQDILLRALDMGLVCCFDPSFFGHHDRFDAIAPVAMQIKGRAYGRGMGYVLRTHRYGALSAAGWIGRPLVRLLFSVGTGNFSACKYFFNVAIGRFEGYLQRPI